MMPNEEIELNLSGLPIELNSSGLQVKPSKTGNESDTDDTVTEDDTGTDDDTVTDDMDAECGNNDCIHTRTDDSNPIPPEDSKEEQTLQKAPTRSSRRSLVGGFRKTMLSKKSMESSNAGQGSAPLSTNKRRNLARFFRKRRAKKVDVPSEKEVEATEDKEAEVAEEREEKVTCQENTAGSIETVSTETIIRREESIQEDDSDPLLSSGVVRRVESIQETKHESSDAPPTIVVAASSAEEIERTSSGLPIEPLVETSVSGIDDSSHQENKISPIDDPLLPGSFVRRVESIQEEKEGSMEETGETKHESSLDTIIVENPSILTEEVEIDSNGLPIEPYETSETTESDDISCQENTEGSSEAVLSENILRRVESTQEDKRSIGNDSTMQDCSYYAPTIVIDTPFVESTQEDKRSVGNNSTMQECSYYAPTIVMHTPSLTKEIDPNSSDHPIAQPETSETGGTDDISGQEPGDSNPLLSTSVERRVESSTQDTKQESSHSAPIILATSTAEDIERNSSGLPIEPPSTPTISEGSSGVISEALESPTNTSSDGVTCPEIATEPSSTLLSKIKVRRVESIQDEQEKSFSATDETKQKSRFDSSSLLVVDPAAVAEELELISKRTAQGKSKTLVAIRKTAEAVSGKPRSKSPQRYQRNDTRARQQTRQSPDRAEYSGEWKRMTVRRTRSESPRRKRNVTRSTRGPTRQSLNRDIPRHIICRSPAAKRTGVPGERRMGRRGSAPPVEGRHAPPSSSNKKNEVEVRENPERGALVSACGISDDSFDVGFDEWYTLIFDLLPLAA